MFKNKIYRPDNMSVLKAGQYQMGSEKFYPEERPIRIAQVAPFRMDRHLVTNTDFSRFIEATRYVTVAERPQPHPHRSGEMIPAGSAVFTPSPLGSVVRGPADWWRYILGANWRNPLGPTSDITGLENHPAVHIALEDALAFAEWAGKELPTEAEWEYAARGGRTTGEYAWGDSLLLNGRHMANTWQGPFPYQNTKEDGFLRTSPVGHYPSNGYGLYDMIGNVWEWTLDPYEMPKVGKEAQSRFCCTKKTASESEMLVIKGGSHLCAPNYCQRYRPAARHGQQRDMGTSHIGFRCIIRE